MPLTEKEMYEFGPFSLDPTERVIFRDGTPVPLTPKVFDTLVCLVRNRGRLLTKDELLKEVWPGTFVEEVNLAVNISTLRKTLGESPQDPRYIATVQGRGYRFVADVRQISARDEAKPNSALQISQLSTHSSLDGCDIKRGRAKTNGTGALLAKLSAMGWEPRLWRTVSTLLVVFLLLALVGGYLRYQKSRRAAPEASAVSIAVLPFTDLSAGKDQEYFCDGLAEDLIDHLATLPSVRVVARSSSFQFKGKNEDLRVVGRKLGVTNILEGSVQREGDRIRVIAELVKADDGFQLWSQTYERRIDDVFSVQDEITHAATGALQLKLVDAKGMALAAKPRSTNSKAYEAYLRAGYFTTRGRDKADLDNALANVEQAIKLDAKYAPAWALRSYLSDTRADVGLTEPTIGFRMAREDAERAIELDPNAPAGYLALAWVQINRDWNWEGAELSLSKAAELEPGSASVLRYRSFLSHSLGRLNEAIEFHRQALARDPLLASSHSYLAFLLYCAGRYEEAETELQRALELNPQKTYDRFTRGEILLQRHRPLEALTEIEQEPAEIWRLTGEALAYHALGRDNDSNAALTQLIKDHQGNMAYQIAEVYADRGESDKAFEWLNRAYEQRDAGLRSLKIDPYLKSLSHDARYADILKKLRLPT